MIPLFRVAGRNLNESAEKGGRGGTDSVRMPSAVSTPSGVSQVTLAVSFPGSAHLSFRLGHLILGGSMSAK